MVARWAAARLLQQSLRRPLPALGRERGRQQSAPAQRRLGDRPGLVTGWDEDRLRLARPVAAGAKLCLRDERRWKQRTPADDEDELGGLPFLVARWFADRLRSLFGLARLERARRLRRERGWQRAPPADRWLRVCRQPGLVARRDEDPVRAVRQHDRLRRA